MNEEKHQLGWIENDIGYEPLMSAGRGYIVTQAFILCFRCNKAISPNMGPRYNAVCFDCYDQINKKDE